MKTAEEMAEEVVTQMDCGSCQSSLEMRKQMTKMITQALTAFAEERVNEALRSGSFKELIESSLPKIKERARAEGIAYAEANQYRDRNDEVDEVFERGRAAALEAFEAGRNDAIREFKSTRHLAYLDAYSSGRKAGLEEAAKIADDEDCVCTDEVNCHGSSRIARSIRALAKAERSDELKDK